MICVTAINFVPTQQMNDHTLCGQDYILLWCDLYLVIFDGHFLAHKLFTWNVHLFVVCSHSTQPKVIYQEEEEDSDEEK